MVVRDGYRAGRASRWIFAGLFAVLVLHAAASAYVLAALFDMRSFQNGWYDHAWQLELAWQARQGDWSGRDFHYPRGPLWQAVAWLASAPWRDALVASDTLAGLAFAFRLASLCAVAWIAWRRVEGPWLRVAALVALATLSFGAGVPTFRAMLSALVILAYVPPEARAPTFRDALPAALLCGIALLLSFDRFAIALLGVALAAGAEWLARTVRRESPRVAPLRAVRFAAVLGVVLAVIGLGAVLAGADLLEYVLGQRQLAAGYASGMRTPWYVGVPPANVLALFLAGAATAGAALALRQPPHVAAWIAGATPSALFGLVTSDPGHVFMALLPLLSVLVVLAASARVSSGVRSGAAVLAAVAMLGWFGTYPDALSVRLYDFREAWSVLRGHKGPDREFHSDHARAIGWARDLVARERPRCIAAWPSLSIVHALADVPGPTELAIRWNDEMQRELARRIEREDCPVYLHHVLSFDDIGGAWFLGPDFVVLAERYAFERRIGVDLVSMRRRPEPRRAPVVPLPARDLELGVVLPGEVVVPLGAEVPGESVVRLDYELDVSPLRAQLGGLPFGEWRFEHRGRPVGEWRTLHHLRAGAGSLYLAPDPEALEWRWMAGTRIDREVVADALRIRLVPRGALSPAAARLTVRSIERIDPPGDPPAPPASWCEPAIDLLERVHQGRVFARNVAPRPSLVHFHLDPLPPGAGLAEVHFPVRPCDEACFFASLGVDAPPSESDGVVFEVHLIHGADRPLLREIEVLPGGEVPIEIPIHLWPGRPQLLRIGTRPRASEASDYAFVSAPRVAPCSARAWLAEDEGDVVVPAEGATLRRSFHVIPSTCFAAGAESTPPARMSVRVAVDGLEHVLHEGPATGGFAVGLHDWTDRDVTLIVEVEPSAGPVRLIGPHIYGCEG